MGFLGGDDFKTQRYMGENWMSAPPSECQWNYSRAAEM